MTTARARRRSIQAYLALVIFMGTATISVALINSYEWISAHLLVFFALAVATTLAERFVINLTLTRQTMSFSVSEVAITIGVLSLPAGPFVLAIALGMAMGQAIRRRPILKASFNTAMYAVSAAGAASAFQMVYNGGRGWLAAILAMAVFFAMNQTILAIIVSLTDARPFTEIMKLGIPILTAVWAGGVTIGILGNELLSNDPGSIWPLAVPFVLCYAAYKALVNTRAEASKMKTLYEASGSLLAHPESNEGLRAFLQKAREMFKAEGAEIITFEGDHSVKVLPADGPETIATLTPSASTAGLLDSYAADRGFRTHLIAAIRTEVGVSGALLVHDRMGPEGPGEFSTLDETLLQSLANEVSIALRNLALFHSINEERKKMADIVTHTSDGIYQVSQDRKILAWNPAMEEITGFSEAEAIGQMCFNILRARSGAGVDVCSSDCPILAAKEAHCHQDREVQIMTKDGSAKWIAYSHSPILDQSGEMTSDVIVVRDVTRQRAAQEAKDDFISTVSHELRTPITPIKGFLKTLSRSDAQFSAEERASFYDRMIRQAERLERIVEDLLDASSLDSGKLRIEVSDLDVTTLTSQMVETFRDAHPTRTFRFSANPGVVALAETTRLEQVVSNLIQNAIKYTPEGTPIDVLVREEGSEIVIGVRDRGPGIPHDEQESVFERFYRSGSHLTREQGGTGLGLFIARRVAEGMGGRLSLTTKIGQGSTFLIHLRKPQPALDPSLTPRL